MNMWNCMCVFNVKLNWNTHIHVSAGNKILKSKINIKNKIRLGSSCFGLIFLCGLPGLLGEMCIWIGVITDVLHRSRLLCPCITPCMLVASDWIRFILIVMAESLHLIGTYLIIFWLNNSLTKYIWPENCMPHVI